MRFFVLLLCVFEGGLLFFLVLFACFLWVLSYIVAVSFRQKSRSLTGKYLFSQWSVGFAFEKVY